MKTVIIHPPIERQGQKITEIMLRKPKAGELRGLKVLNLMQGDAAEVIELLPRISDPAILKVEAADLSSETIADLSLTVIGFFLREEESRSE